MGAITKDSRDYTPAPENNNTGGFLNRIKRWVKNNPNIMSNIFTVLYILLHPLLIAVIGKSLPYSMTSLGWSLIVISSALIFAALCLWDLIVFVSFCVGLWEKFASWWEKE